MRLLTAFLLLLLFASINVGAQDFIGLKSLNGTQLFVSIKGKGETIVVLHGGPGLNHSYFKPHLDALEKKFRMVYYDQRASGASSTPSPDSISMKFFIEDLEALRNHLKVERLNVLAHSWGALLLTHYALQHPNRIKKVMMVSPAMLSREYDKDAALLAKTRATSADSIERSTILSRGKDMKLEDYDKLLKLSFKASAYDRSNIDKLNLNLPGNFTAANRTLFTGLMKDPAANANLYDSLRKLNFPALIVHGEADIVPKDAIERLRKNLPLGSLMIFEKSGHFPFVEENKRFLELAKDYFSKN